HTYAIGYDVRGAFNHFAEYEELYWNAVGTEWEVPIAKASVTVDGPAAVTQVTCFAGPSGSNQECDQKSMSGNTATFGQSKIGNGKGLTIVVAFPPGSITNTAPILEDRRDLTTAFRVTPVTAGFAAGLGLVGAAAALVVAFLYGRDRRYVGQLPGLVPG